MLKCPGSDKTCTKDRYDYDISIYYRFYPPRILRIKAPDGTDHLIIILYQSVLPAHLLCSSARTAVCIFAIHIPHFLYN